ncbi:glucuronate isomerase [Flavihumibacter sp. UBA7668]|uniref:glucuronate isomerase n=1 Tax=Flavihumibacter sp. UBA7668 TaxID=1946542 RepID=UPI0025B8CA83|nr:glucuronate isomerase [Flavihumibacter sp. UBA7668]
MEKQLQQWPDESFILQNEAARRLYVDFAKDQPIIDYHCHLSPDEIAANKQFENLTQIWLKGDHYKWRAMRALGVSEEFITGTASDQDKFMAWAKLVPRTIRNPLFHWTVMEMANPFGIKQLLNASTGAGIYDTCNQLLQTPDFSTQALIRNRKVELVGTTDDPCDDLAYHKLFVQQNAGFQMLPSFRPDPVLNVNNQASWLAYLGRLEAVTGRSINQLDDLLEALDERIQYFHNHGCRVADLGLVQLPDLMQLRDKKQVEQEFRLLVSTKNYQVQSPDSLAGFILLHICRKYKQFGWVQQFHLGAIRNLNTRLLTRLGADSGVDSIGDDQQGIRLARFLDALDQTDELAKTILYNLNPALNEVFASMTGNFNDGSIVGKIQFGSGWWFLDQMDGMEKQLNALSSIGILSSFIGMTTDSRSFLSYSRHDYFRRILCNLIGTDMEKGLLPMDYAWMGTIVSDICYTNARNYFDLP